MCRLDELKIHYSWSHVVFNIFSSVSPWVVLVHVNVANYRIPSFYIFHGKSFQRDYIKQCEDKASMAMQVKV
jgi:hypothetical protein